jgi:oxygen-dependent protoporphyrinogen oxidase
LEDSLPVHFHYDEEVQAISKKEAYEVQTSKGIYQADYLFSALPCQIIGKLLLPQLLNIPLVGTTVINLGYHKKVINKKGFGYMVSSAEKEPVLGVDFESNSFTQLNRSPQETRLTVMLQGIEYSEKEAREIALKAVKKHLKISSLPDVSLVRHAPAVFPQFNVGFGELMQDVEKTIEQKYPGFYLAGNYIQGAGVSDCIARAASVVDIFLRATVS